MIRSGTPADVPAILDMIEAFRAEVLPAVPYHHASARELVSGLIDSRHGFVGVLDLGHPRGVLLAAASAYPWAPVLAADELLWWIAPGERGRWAAAFLDDYEAWARELGARLTGLNHSGKDAGPLYRRRGYAPAETKFFKVT